MHSFSNKKRINQSPIHLENFPISIEFYLHDFREIPSWISTETKYHNESLSSRDLRSSSRRIYPGGKKGAISWRKEIKERFKEERATQKRELGRVYAIRHIRIITTTGMPVDCGMLCANASRHLHHFYQIQLFPTRVLFFFPRRWKSFFFFCIQKLVERIEKKAFDFTIFDQVNVQFLRSSNERARLEDSWRICTRHSDLWIG